MAKNFVWDYKAAGDLLLRSEEIAKVCEEAAVKMTRATGVEYKTGRTKERVVVEPEDAIAEHENKFPRDPETGWPICPKCGEAHYYCSCWRKKG